MRLMFFYHALLLRLFRQKNEVENVEKEVIILILYNVTESTNVSTDCPTILCHAINCCFPLCVLRGKN